MTAIHVLKLPHITATIKVYEAEDVLEIVGRCFSHEWNETGAIDEWWLSVLDLYADDPRRIETRWEAVDTYAKLFVSPFHVLWHAKPNDSLGTR
jgi:hypothetical protein